MQKQHILWQIAITNRRKIIKIVGTWITGKIEGVLFVKIGEVTRTNQLDYFSQD